MQSFDASPITQRHARSERCAARHTPRAPRRSNDEGCQAQHAPPFRYSCSSYSAVRRKSTRPMVSSSGGALRRRHEALNSRAHGSDRRLSRIPRSPARGRCRQTGQPPMEPLWRSAVAIPGNRWQTDQRRNGLKEGGHFAAWEEPELLSEELRAAFASVRGVPKSPYPRRSS